MLSSSIKDFPPSSLLPGMDSLEMSLLTKSGFKNLVVRLNWVFKLKVYLLSRVNISRPFSKRNSFSKHQFPGAFEKDVFPAIIFAGAFQALRIGACSLHIRYEFGLIPEARRPPVFLINVLL
jgi:hypothetical protein